MIDNPVDVAGREDLRSRLPRLDNLGRVVGGRSRVGKMVRQENAPEKPDALGDEGAEIDAPAIQTGHQGKHRRSIPVGHRPRQHGHRIPVGHSQSPFHPFRIDSPFPQGGHLLQEAERVANAPARMAGHGLQAVLGYLIPLAAGNRLQMAGEKLRRNRQEVETLAPGTNGVQELVGLGGGQDEVDIGRGLLQCLEKGVASRHGKHVRFIKDEDPVGRGAGGHHGHLHPDVPDVLHRVVGGGVQLLDIERTAVGDGLAGGAVVAGFAIGAGVLAVDRLGKDASG